MTKQERAEFTIDYIRNRTEGVPDEFLSDKRQADINRVNKAKEHLKAATTILSNIKWENVSGLEYHLVFQCWEVIKDADSYLDDTINIQKER